VSEDSRSAVEALLAVLRVATVRGTGSRTALTDPKPLVMSRSVRTVRSENRARANRPGRPPADARE